MKIIIMTDKIVQDMVRIGLGEVTLIFVNENIGFDKQIEIHKRYFIGESTET